VGQTTVKLGMPADGATDTRRLQGELQKKRQEIEFIQGKLDNPDFTSKAPGAVVDRERARLAQAQQAADRLRDLLGETPELG
jgi:valyl-tRNA synthetase